MPVQKYSRVRELYREGGLAEVTRGVTDFVLMNTPGIQVAGGPLARNIRQYGVRHGLPYAAAEVALQAIPEDDTGMHVFDADWDVLIVLDTCRAEWLDRVASEYDFIGDVESIRSVGGRTSEWVSRTFSEIPIDDASVSYVYSSKYGDIATEVSDVNTAFVSPGEYKYPPAHWVTDCALEEIATRVTDGRVIVHYSQPHFPVFDTTGGREDVTIRHETNHGPIRAYLESNTSMEAVESLYIDNLRYVLDEIRYLLNQVEGRDVVVTADHGESLGERFIVGHPPGTRHKATRRVPWARLEQP